MDPGNRMWMKSDLLSSNERLGCAGPTGILVLNTVPSSGRLKNSRALCERCFFWSKQLVECSWLQTLEGWGAEERHTVWKKKRYISRGCFPRLPFRTSTSMSVVQNPLFLKRARTFESDFACAPTAVARSAEGKLVAWESWQWPESWKAQFERLNIRSFANLFSPGLWKIETTFLTWKKHFPNGYCYLHGFEKNHLWKWKRSLACHNFFFQGPEKPSENVTKWRTPTRRIPWNIHRSFSHRKLWGSLVPKSGFVQPLPMATDQHVKSLTFTTRSFAKLFCHGPQKTIVFGRLSKSLLATPFVFWWKLIRNTRTAKGLHCRREKWRRTTLLWSICDFFLAETTLT